MLDTLAVSDRALTAHELLDRMREAGLGKEPPIVYRALDFLMAQGLVHRVERLSAYVACASVATCRQPSAFLICCDCRRVTEVPIDLAASHLDAAARGAGFTVGHVFVEVEGRCETCRPTPAGWEEAGPTRHGDASHE
ncbi:transcriptional repressor [Amaricoccus solimangrovi]|uniref:transcriptional repressor n=1 Tax=Amaricoccus solimangrovi TaxID=2589815 RepID=UPI0015E2F934|nr:transcriptional repressor [Amaricoccus solimangrovi]